MKRAMLVVIVRRALRILTTLNFINDFFGSLFYRFAAVYLKIVILHWLCETEIGSAEE